MSSFGLLKDKTALITGIASKRSIAFGIAEAFYKQGAKLILTYQNDRLKSRVEEAAKMFGNCPIIQCDVSSDEMMSAFKQELEDLNTKLDCVIHSIGFAPAEELQGSLVDNSTRHGFTTAHDISSYSFISLTQATLPLLNEGASLLTLTYHASQQTVPNYNVMGLAKASLEAGIRYLARDLGSKTIRVNGISAGPIKTLAASGVKSFRSMLDEHSNRAPLGRSVTIEEVGNTACFLASNMASGITGEIIYVDAGFRSTAIGNT